MLYAFCMTWSQLVGYVFCVMHGPKNSGEILQAMHSTTSFWKNMSLPPYIVLFIMRGVSLSDLMQPRIWISGFWPKILNLLPLFSLSPVCTTDLLETVFWTGSYPFYQLLDSRKWHGNMGIKSIYLWTAPLEFALPVFWCFFSWLLTREMWVYLLDQ